MEISCIFILSLPRSGSTLLQRMLGKRKEISTVSEPWILLPLLYSLKEEGCFTEYSHYLSVKAISDFCKELPGGREDYLNEMKAFVKRIYQKAASPNADYFLDKTPRYSLISNEIVDIFNEEKIIFLWRNPLSIAASLVSFAGKGKWNLYKFKVDLYDGLENLVKAYKRTEPSSLSINYEDLIKNNKHQLDKIYNYLSLPKIATFSTDYLDCELSGFGDVSMYQDLSKEPIEKWKDTLRNPLRKAWSRRYLHWIGKDRLHLMGYDLDLLLNEIDTLPFSTDGLLSDLLLMLYGIPYSFLEPRLMKRKLRTTKNFRQVHFHD